MRASGSTSAFGRSPWPQARARAQFHPEPRLDVKRSAQRPDAYKPFSEKGTKPAGAAQTEISFGPFRLLPTQFLLLESGKPVALGSRALEILIVLLEQPGELVSKQELTARVGPMSLSRLPISPSICPDCVERCATDETAIGSLSIFLDEATASSPQSTSPAGWKQTDAPRFARDPSRCSLGIGRSWPCGGALSFKSSDEKFEREWRNRGSPIVCLRASGISSTRAACRDWTRPHSQGKVMGYPGHGLNWRRTWT